MTDYGDAHRKHMQHELERQNQEWRALNRQGKDLWPEKVVVGLWLLIWILIGILIVFGLNWLESFARHL